MRKPLLWIITAASLFLSVSCNAQSISYVFTVNGGAAGPLAGVTSTGTFTFDSSIIPGSGGELQQTGLLTNLSFAWDGITYNANTANTGFLAFDTSNPFGQPGGFEAALFGNDCSGSGCGAQNNDNWFVSAFPNRDGTFAYNVGNTVYNGTVGILQQSRATAAPELDPSDASSAVILLVGLVALATGRRRNAA